MTEKVVLALGSNLGDRDANLTRGLALVADGIGPILSESARYSTEPLLHPETPTGGQRDYLNMVALVATSLDPTPLLDECQRIEQLVGRDRNSEPSPWQPRMLDIDVIAIGDLAIDSPRLTVPHPRMHERAFVLEPLLEVWPDWIHPVLRRSTSELLFEAKAFQVHEEFMDKALALAYEALSTEQHPRPMAAIVVLDSKVVGSGTSQVTTTLDPTAHAEIVAIRKACQTLKSRDLSGAVLYTTAEPCPMCLAAVYYAGIREVYYGLPSENALEYGFADIALRGEICRSPHERAVHLHPCKRGDAVQLFSKFAKDNPRYRSRLFRCGILRNPRSNDP